MAARGLKVGGAALAVGIALAAWPWMGPAESLAGERDPALAASPAEPPLVALGRRLFQDPSVSRSGKFACASCHDAEHGWSDADRVSKDEGGPTRRHSQPVTDLAGAGFHWDGEFPAVRDLIVARIGSTQEATKASVLRAAATAGRAKQIGGVNLGREGSYSPGGGGDVVTFNDGQVNSALPASIPARVGADDRYAAAFSAAFGSADVTSDRLVTAVDAFVGSLRTERNALDRYVAGDAEALPVAAQRGFRLFAGRAACATCHKLDLDADGRVTLTDGTFHNTGVAFAQPAQGKEVQQEQPRPQGRRRRGLARNGGGNGGGNGGDNINGETDMGRAERSSVEAELGSFKTASLRDVARRGPYMHDGSLRTLADVVRYYAKGGTTNPHLDPAIKPFELTVFEVGDLVAFLESLSGAKRPGLLPARAAEKRSKIRVLDVTGAPMANATIDVVPCGERLGEDAPAKTMQVTTSSQGVAEFVFPQTTHVRLEKGTMQIGFGRPIPDTAGDLDLVAAPADRIVVTLRGANLAERLEGTVRSDPFIAIMLRSLDDEDELVDVQLSPELTQMPIVTAPETFVFERIRVVAPGEAVYVAKLGKTRGRQIVRFSEAGDTALAAAIDLDGGASLPAQIRKMHVRRIDLGENGPVRREKK